MSTSDLPKPLQDAEIEAIRTRRKEAGVTKGADVKKDTVGLAISGGGIRSATFSLGVLQSLADKEILPKIDYMSTVSGGGFVGSMLGRLLTRGWVTKNGAAQPGEAHKRVASALNDHNSPVIEWLRNCGRYLSASGSGSMMTGLTTTFRNWLSLNVVMIISLLTVFFAGEWVRQSLVRYAPGLFSWTCPDSNLCGLWLSPWFLLAGLIALFTILLVYIYWLWPTNAQLSANVLTAASFAAITMACSTFFGMALAPQTGMVIPEALKKYSEYCSLLMHSYFLPPWDYVCGYSALFLLVASLYVILRLFLSKVIEHIDKYAQRRPENRLLALLKRVFAYNDVSTRRKLTNKTSSFLSLGVIVFVWACIDTLSQSLWAVSDYYRSTSDGSTVYEKLVIIGALVTGLLSVSGRIMTLFKAPSAPGKARSTSLSALGLVGSIVILLPAVILLNATPKIVVYWLSFEPTKLGLRVLQQWLPAERFARLDSTVLNLPYQAPDIDSLLIIAAILLVITILLGMELAFANMSSLNAFYSGRLTRAYLGASNDNRWKGCAAARSVDEPLSEDGCSWGKYNPHAYGGPIHIINVCMNETIDGLTNVEQQDRKGRNFAITPFGITAGLLSHAKFGATPGKLTASVDGSAFNAFAAGTEVSADDLPVGTWVGISGAAFGTGLGRGNNIGLSMIQFLAGLRLGYWWDSGVAPGRRASWPPKWTVGRFFSQCFRLQSYLIDEMMGRFHGFNRRHWYLSDGGHFENTGAYELIRRRVPFIIVIDAGADPKYEFQDIGQLVMLARCDFGTTITFMGSDELQNWYPTAPLKGFGALKDFARDSESKNGLNLKFNGAHSAIATIKYPDDSSGTLVVIKPSLNGDESADLQQYLCSHPDFPQETTADQFFDEAQWESYRALGKHIGDELAPFLEKHVSA